MKDSVFRHHNAQVRVTALRALRKRILLRKCMAVTLLAVAGLMLFPWVWGGKELGVKSVVQSPETHVVGTNTGRVKSNAELSDEELLRCFPPGSCYLAEVDGRKRLVFRDPEMKRRFFN